MREGALRDADDSADRERRGVYENVLAIDKTPFVTPRRGTQLLVLVVVDLFAAIPVFVLDGCTFLPFLVLNVGVVVGVILGKGETAARKACGKDCKCQNIVESFHFYKLLIG